MIPTTGWQLRTMPTDLECDISGTRGAVRIGFSHGDPNGDDWRYHDAGVRCPEHL